jgi:pimeloyl-ACP methyl ester carboxylesterase
MTRRNHVSDLRGVSRLALDATRGVIDLVEAMHHTVVRVPGILGVPITARTRGITGLVYRSVRGVAGLVGAGIDVALGELARLIGEARSPREAEALVAALNGVLGDYLLATANPLAIQMRLRRGGRPLELEGRALRLALPRASKKLLLLVHGSSMNDLQWNRQGHDHGAALEREHGYVAVYLHYNSGLHISTNGRALATLLETAIAQWPVPLEEIAIVAHSMGGLVARSACHAGASLGHRWPAFLRKLVFLGTPHHGAQLEQGGNWVDFALGLSPYSAPFARLGKIRSAGITDLRYGSVLDEDWEQRDRFELRRDSRRPVPLPAGVNCFAMAAIRGKSVATAGPSAGDGLVSLDSALGRHPNPDLTLAFPEARQWVGTGMSHVDLLSRPEVYEVLSRWFSPQDGARARP